MSSFFKGLGVEDLGYLRLSAYLCGRLLPCGRAERLQGFQLFEFFFFVWLSKISDLEVLSALKSKFVFSAVFEVLARALVGLGFKDC